MGVHQLVPGCTPLAGNSVVLRPARQPRGVAVVGCVVLGFCPWRYVVVRYCLIVLRVHAVGFRVVSAAVVGGMPLGWVLVGQRVVERYARCCATRWGVVVGLDGLVG